MIALVMIMLHILLERMPQGAFTKQNQAHETLLFDRSHQPLRIGIQIGRPWQQWYTLHSSRIDETLKRQAEFIVSVMDQILPRREEAPFVHGDVPRHLGHPRLIGMGRDSRDMDFPAAQMDEKQHVVCHQPTQYPDLSG